MAKWTTAGPVEAMVTTNVQYIYTFIKKTQKERIQNIPLALCYGRLKLMSFVSLQDCQPHKQLIAITLIS